MAPTCWRLRLPGAALVRSARCSRGLCGVALRSKSSSVGTGVRASFGSRCVALAFTGSATRSDRPRERRQRDASWREQQGGDAFETRPRDATGTRFPRYLTRRLRDGAAGVMNRHRSSGWGHGLRRPAPAASAPVPYFRCLLPSSLPPPCISLGARVPLSAVCLVVARGTLAVGGPRRSALHKSSAVALFESGL